MNLSMYLLRILVPTLAYASWVRGFINCIIEYRIGSKGRKKRNQGRTIFQWFFFTRYRDAVPHSMIVWYFSILLFGLAASIAVIIMTLLDWGHENALLFSNIVFCVMLFPALISAIFIKTGLGWGVFDVTDFVSRKGWKNKKKK